MLSSVLNTETSISVSVQIIKAFVNMRRFLMIMLPFFLRIDHLEISNFKCEEKFENCSKH
jgi:hypothetical protein